MWRDIVIVAFPFAMWVLLPLVPSILIFLIFPTSTITADGPLAGLTVRASGAFAAYLVVFAAIAAPIIQSAGANINDLQHRFWTVSGYIELLNTKGEKIRSREYLDDVIVKTIPDPHTTSGGSLVLRIVEGETKKLPRINIQVRNFGEETIDLDSLVATDGDYAHKIISLQKPIQIKSQEPFPVAR